MDSKRKNQNSALKTKKNAQLIYISKMTLAKDIHPKNKLSTFYESKPYIVTKVWRVCTSKCTLKSTAKR